MARLKSVVPEAASVWSAPEERLTRGRAYREILKVAKDEGVELIVMDVQGKAPDPTRLWLDDASRDSRGRLPRPDHPAVDGGARTHPKALHFHFESDVSF